MMSLKRIFSLLLVFLSVSGIFLSIVGIITIWVINEPVTNGLVNFIYPLETTLRQLDHTLQKADSGLAAIQEPAQALSSAVQGFQDFFPGTLGDISKITSALADLQSDVSEAHSQLSGLIEISVWLQSAIPKWIDYFSILLTFMLLWFIFAQAALFVHAWYFLTGTDLLKSWR